MLDLLEKLGAEREVILKAPWSFCFAVLVFCAIVYAGFSAINSGVISAKDATIENLKIQIDGLKGTVAEQEAKLKSKPSAVTSDDEKKCADAEEEARSAIAAKETADGKLEAANRRIDEMTKQLQGKTDISITQEKIPTAPDWTAQEIATRLDLWKAVSKQINQSVMVYNEADMVFGQWEERVASNKSEYISVIARVRRQISEASDEMEKIRAENSNFKDVSDTIDQPYIGPLLNAVDSLSTAIIALPEPLPQNYKSTIRQFAGAVRVQMQGFVDWISNVESTSGSKQNQLLIMSRK